MRFISRFVLPTSLGFTVLATSGCSTFQQYAALEDVEFHLAGVSDVRLAGIELDRMSSYEDLGMLDLARLAQAVGQNELPLDLDVHVGALNPADNGTEARLMRMDWTLLLEDREALNGTLDEEIILPPGQPMIIPIAISLNLVEFYEGNAQDLLELGLALAGQGGAGKNVALRISPVINTPLGAIRYPQPITLVNERVGG